MLSPPASRVSLSDIEFPLKLSIFISGFAEEELKQFGYDDFEDYEIEQVENKGQLAQANQAENCCA